VGAWLAKGLLEWEERGVGSVFLLPARTDTRWWHDLVMPNFTMLGFVKGRLKFDDQPVPAPFPCVLVRFGTVGADCYGVQTFDAKGNWLEQNK
jgi:site-specific DNA-methyltransferase (adenine-specific)